MQFITTIILFFLHRPIFKAGMLKESWQDLATGRKQEVRFTLKPSRLPKIRLFSKFGYSGQLPTEGKIAFRTHIFLLEMKKDT
jgi:hypothetical protein